MSELNVLAPGSSMKMAKSLDFLPHSETRARRYLIEKSWKNKTHFCVRCHNEKVYRLADKRYRCARCGYTFQEFAGRWVAELKISAAQWLWTLKLFELEIAYSRIADEVGITYPTVLKATRLIRCAMLQQYLSGKSKVDAYWNSLLLESIPQARAAGPSRREGIVYAVEQRDETVEVAPVRNVSKATLRKSNAAVVKLGPVVYAIPQGKSRALILRGSRRPAHRGTPSTVRNLPEAGAVENFLAFAKSRFARLPKISEQEFPLYLMEMKIRYDHRSGSLFELLAGAITQLVPTY